MAWRFAISALFLLLPFVPLSAQDEDRPEEVHFSTVDGVELTGHFHAGKAQGPTVLLLHALGEDRHSKGWFDLPKELKKKGFSVLSFDFRGHGDSKTVAPDKFWSNGFNKTWVKPTKGNTQTIEYKNFDKRYIPALVNDIAAARAYLDRTKNDKGACNTSNLILIGAETGATLGAVWLNAEWFRYKLNAPMVFGQIPMLEPQPEAKDVIGAVWLSVSPTIGAHTVSISKLMDASTRGKAMATVLLYSDKDEKGRFLAKGIEKVLKGKDDKYQFVGATEVKGANTLNGASLLNKSLGTDVLLAKYLEEVAQKKNNEWVERDYRKTMYVWKVGTGIVPAKQPGDQVLNFDTYEKFLKQ